MSPSVAIPARENPFRVDRTDALQFRFSSGTWSSHLARLSELEYRAAIVGPQGSGKTTLLAELAEHLRDTGLSPVICRATDNRAANRGLVSKLTSLQINGQIILLDSAEMLSRMTWLRLLRQTKPRAGLVVAVHRPCALPTWMRCEPTWKTMRGLLRDLDFIDDHDAIIVAARDKYFAHGGNIRDVFRELYDEISNGKHAGVRDVNAQAQNRSTAFDDR